MPSVREILRSAFSRFLPGWAIGLTAFPLVFAPRSFLELGPIQFELIAMYTAAALTGHVVALGALRSRLRDDAEVTGRKSIVAGACSVGGLLITSMMPHGLRGYTSVVLTYAGVATVITAAMYLPWIRTSRTAGQSIGDDEDLLIAPALNADHTRDAGDAVSAHSSPPAGASLGSRRNSAG